MSLSVRPPSWRCSSNVAWPPEKANEFIFFLICFAVSVSVMLLFALDDDILLPGPCRAGKKIVYGERGSFRS